MKLFVGAIVASAIEIRLAREPEQIAVAKGNWNPADYVGEYRWINFSASEQGGTKFTGTMAKS